MTYEPQQPSLDSPDSLPTPNKRHSTTSKSSPTVKTPLTDPMLSQHLKENATLAVAGPASSRKFPSFSSWQHQQSNQRNRAMGRERRELEARHIFESTVRRYYYQLTIGCANPQCTNKLCVSCKISPKFSSEAAAIMALHLASRPRQFFCSNCPVDPPISLPESITTKFSSSKSTPSTSSSATELQSPPSLTPLTAEQTDVKPFLYALFSSTPFSTIFTTNRDKDSEAVSRSPASRRHHKQNHRHHHRGEVHDQQQTASALPLTPTASAISANPLQRHHPHHHTSNSPVPSSPTTPTRTSSQPLRRSGSLKRKSSSSNIPSSPATTPITPVNPTTRATLRDSAPAAARAVSGAPQPHQSQQQQQQFESPASVDSLFGNDDNYVSSVTAEPEAIGLYIPAPGWKMRNLWDFNGLMASAGVHLGYGRKKPVPAVSMSYTPVTSGEGQEKGYTGATQDHFASETGDEHSLTTAKGNRRKKSKSKRQKSQRERRHQKTRRSAHDVLDELRRKRGMSDGSGSSGSSSGEESEAGDTETITSLSSSRSIWEEDREDREDREDATDTTTSMTLEVLERAVEAYRAAAGDSERSDPRSLIHIFCKVFAEWEVLGNSFVSPSASSLDGEMLPTLASPDVDFASLRNAYTLLLSLEPRHVFTGALVNAMELLLARMELNVDGVFSGGVEDDEVRDVEGRWRIAHEWCRALVCILECPLVCGVWESEVSGEEQTLDWKTILSRIDEGLMRKVVGVLYRIGSRKGNFLRKLMVERFGRYDMAGMTRVVQAFHSYLNDHFHVGPFNQGEEDAVVRVVTVLELLYDANKTAGADHVVPPEVFYSEAVCKKLNIKDEYRVWKSMLFYAESTTTSSSSQRDVNDDSRRRQSKRPLILSAVTSSLVIPYGLHYETDFQFSFLSYPFLFTPSTKARIMHVDAMSQMSAEYEDACVNHTLVMHAQRLLSDSPRMVHTLEMHLRSATCPYLLLEVGRERIVDDTIEQISRKWADLKKPLKVKFVGGGEEGMDQGGVQKEFFAVVMERMMDDEWGMFVSDEETRVTWLQGGYLEEEGTPEREMEEATARRQYEMAGVVMGLAIYNGVILGIQFPKVMWKVLTMTSEEDLQKAAADRVDAGSKFPSLFSLEDLEEGWPALGRGLRQMLEWKQEDGDVADVFCRNFEISYEVFGKGVVNIPLCEGGSDIPVTNENRHEYVRQYCHHFMYLGIKDRLLAFRRGVWAVVGGMAVRMCRPEELEMVVCGARNGGEGDHLDLSELEEATGYDDGYDSMHQVIRDFWSIVHEMDAAQKRRLLMFVTASDRIPIGGLKDVTFIVQRNGPDSDRLPTALTCFSRLLLPEYSTKEKLRERLLTAIENAKGFGLV